MKSFISLIVIVLLVGCGNENDQDINQLDEVNEELLTTGFDDKEVDEQPFEPMDMFFKKLEETPVELEFEGKVIDAYWWNDRNGENYFLRTLEEKESEIMDEEYGTGDMAFYTQSLHAYHYVLTEEKSELILMRELLDFEKECDFDLMVQHMPAVSFNDADLDNYGEITFGYMLACRSDVSPSTYKVFTFENGDKYGLRGQSETMGFGGDYEVGKEFESVSDSVLTQAILYWDEHKVEFD